MRKYEILEQVARRWVSRGFVWALTHREATNKWCGLVGMSRARADLVLTAHLILD